MATKAPPQKSNNQLPQQKDQNPPAANTQKPASNQPAKDAPKDASKDARQSVLQPPSGQQAQNQQQQSSKTNLQVQQNDPNSRKGSTVAPVGQNPQANVNQQPPAANNQQNNRGSVSKEPAQAPNNQDNPSKNNSLNNLNNGQNINQNHNNPNLMGNFFDSLGGNQNVTADDNIDDDDLKDDENDTTLKPIPTDDPKELERRKNQAEMFKKYLDNTGVSMAFQIIYAEILSKKINQDNVYGYTAMRLRQIGNDLAAISLKAKK